jgi:hypothetical protein
LGGKSVERIMRGKKEQKCRHRVSNFMEPAMESVERFLAYI